MTKIAGKQKLGIEEYNFSKSTLEQVREHVCSCIQNKNCNLVC